MVEPAFVETVLGPPDYVVPLQDVGGQGLGHDVGDRILGWFRLVEIINSPYNYTAPSLV